MYLIMDRSAFNVYNVIHVSQTTADVSPPTEAPRGTRGASPARSSATQARRRYHLRARRYFQNDALSGGGGELSGRPGNPDAHPLGLGTGVGFGSSRP